MDWFGKRDLTVPLALAIPTKLTTHKCLYSLHCREKIICPTMPRKTYLTDHGSCSLFYIPGLICWYFYSYQMWKTVNAYVKVVGLTCWDKSKDNRRRSRINRQSDCLRCNRTMLSSRRFSNNHNRFSSSSDNTEESAVNILIMTLTVWMTLNALHWPIAPPNQGMVFSPKS